MRILNRSLVAAMVTLLLASVSHAQSQEVDVGALRSMVSIRLDRTTPTNPEASDWGGKEVATAIQALVSKMRYEVARGHISGARLVMAQVFSLIPVSDRSFEYLLPTDPKNAPTTVFAIKRAIYDVEHMVVDNADMRMEYLSRINILFARHSELLKKGPRYLEVFSVWTSHLVELAAYQSRLSPEERALINEFQSLYRQGINTMKAAQVMQAQPAVEANRRAAVAALAVAKTCENVFQPTSR